MITPIIEQVVEQLESLPEDLQRRVLEFVQGLKGSAFRGALGKQLIRFVGFIPLDDLQQMRQAIESDCEQVDMNGRYLLDTNIIAIG